jgi:probable dihydroxyacetone kinase regulator
LKNKDISYQTKKALAASLKKALQKKPFSKITVSELIRDCNLNRNTFYYHFEDIYALLHWMFAEEALDMAKHFEFLTDYRASIQFIMEYAESNEHILNCIYDAIGRGELKRFFYSDFAHIIGSILDQAEKESGKNLDPDFKNFATLFYTEAIASILVDWLKEKEFWSREKTIDYLCRIIDNGLYHFPKHPE